MARRPPPTSPRRTLVRWLIRSEPVALVLLLILAVLLFAITIAIGGHHGALPTTSG